MKKKLFTTLLFIITGYLTVFAAPMTKAYYVTLQGDTVWGEMKLHITWTTGNLDMTSYYYAPKFYKGKDERGRDIKIKLKAPEIKGYGFVYKDKYMIRLLSATVKGGTVVGNKIYFRTETVFYYLEQNGKYAKLLKHPKGGVMGADDCFLLKAGETIPIQFSPGSFKDVLIKQLADCPEMVALLEQNQYDKKNIAKIIKDYNKLMYEVNND